MKEKYDFSTAKRGPVASSKGKTRITIMLDDDVIEAARECAESAGTRYQTSSTIYCVRPWYLRLPTRKTLTTVPLTTARPNLCSYLRYV